MTHQTSKELRTVHLNPSFDDRNCMAMKKNSCTVTVRQPRDISHESILQILAKDRETRNSSEIKILIKYLSMKYKYFSQLRETGEFSKLANLVKVLNLEIFSPEETIIRFGEEGDKFYVLLSGTVEWYKIIYNQVTMSLREYINYLEDFDKKQGGNLIRERVLEKNAHWEIDLKLIFSIPLDSDYLNAKYDFFVEGMELLNEFSDGFAFGDIAWLRKTKRNATIVAKTKSQLVSIDKLDYNRIMRQLSEKKWEKSLKEFQKTYKIFEKWNMNLWIKLFNCFSTVELISGEYWYRQDDESNYIYIVVKGKFELYSLVSLGWVKEFFDYIVYAKSNILNFWDSKHPLKEQDLIKAWNKKYKDMIKSPCKFDPYRINNITTSLQRRDNILDWETEKEKVVNIYNWFKIKVRDVTEGEVLGWEDSWELKNRFYFAKCRSQKAEVKKIAVNDFYRLMNIQAENWNKNIWLNIIAEKKSILFQQIRKAVNKRIIGYEAWFNEKFDTIINSSEHEDAGEELEIKEYNNKSATIKNRKQVRINHKDYHSNTIKYWKTTYEEDTLKNQYQTYHRSQSRGIKHGKKGDDIDKVGNQDKNDTTLTRMISKLPTINHNSNKEQNKKLGLQKRNVIACSNDISKCSDNNNNNNNIHFTKKDPLTHPSFTLCNHNSSSWISSNKDSLSLLNYPKSKQQQQQQQQHNMGEFRISSRWMNMSLNTNNIGNQTQNSVSRTNRSRNILNSMDEGISFNSKEYRSILSKDKEWLTSEIFRWTGMKRIVPQKEITYNIYDDDDEKILWIESKKQRRNQCQIIYGLRIVELIIILIVVYLLKRLARGINPWLRKVKQ